MKLYCVRHGETDWNTTRRNQGQTDIPLNDAGLKQAESLAMHLQRFDFNGLYSSDLSRAAATARIIGTGSNVQVSLRPELREVNFGKLEGLTGSEIRHKFPDVDIRRLNFAGLGGEDLGDLEQRIRSFLDEIHRIDGENTFVLVGHGASMRVVICTMLGIESGNWYKMNLGNASLSLIEGSPGNSVLRYLNDTCFLKKFAKQDEVD